MLVDANGGLIGYVLSVSTNGVQVDVLLNPELPELAGLSVRAVAGDRQIRVLTHQMSYESVDCSGPPFMDITAQLTGPLFSKAATAAPGTTVYVPDMAHTPQPRAFGSNHFGDLRCRTNEHSSLFSVPGKAIINLDVFAVPFQLH
jgi:hypothetical protein